MVKGKFKYDGGYGVNGNPSHYIVLNGLLNEEQSKIFREELEKEDKRKYLEYLEYEERVNNYKDGS
jgi:hypothetical protein